MKLLHAVILLAVYSAFHLGVVFGKHACNDYCMQAVVNHTEANTPPTECTEKEVVSNTLAEHRSGTILKLHVKSNPAAKEGRLASNRELLSKIVLHENEANNQAVVPLYITHCVYRL